MIGQKNPGRQCKSPLLPHPRQRDRQPPEIAFLQLAPPSQQIHGHEDVAVIKERTPQPGHAINLPAVRCRGNKEASRRALAGAKSRGPTRQVRATLALPGIDPESGNSGFSVPDGPGHGFDGDLRVRGARAKRLQGALRVQSVFTPCCYSIARVIVWWPSCGPATSTALKGGRNSCCRRSSGSSGWVQSAVSGLALRQTGPCLKLPDPPKNNLCAGIPQGVYKSGAVES